MTTTIEHDGSSESASPARVAVGVAGAGWWATETHLPALLAHPGADVIGLADTNPTKLHRAADHYGIPGRYGSVEELVAAGARAVIVATSHTTHFDVARRAIEAGASVLVEKPMTTVSAEARELVAFAAARGVHLVVGTTFQFTETAAACRAAVSGRIGDLLHVSVRFASMVEAFLRGAGDEYRSEFVFPVGGPDAATYSDPAVSGGGQAQTQLSHALGMTLWVTGRHVTRASAVMHTGGLAVDLVDAGWFELEGGAVCTVSATGSLAAGQPAVESIEYYGTAGYVTQDLATGQVEVHVNGAGPEVHGPLLGGDAYPAAAPATRLVDLLLGRTDHNPSPGESGARAVALVEAMYRSADRSGAPVAVER